jgi:hypothetical protein
MKTNHETFETGRGLWLEYTRLNGYAFRPTRQGLAKLSRLLDLNIPYLQKMINAFLEA